LARPNLIGEPLALPFTWQEVVPMLAKLQEQLQALLQALGLAPQPQPIRISEAEQQRLRRERQRR